MSDKKYQSLEDLQKGAAYWRKQEAFLRDRMNRYGPDFWHYKVNAAVIRAKAFEAEIARRVPA